MKKWKQIVAIILMSLIITLSAGVTKAAVKNPSLVELKSEKTYKKYDITGNKKKDTIKISIPKDKNNRYGTIKIVMNGKSQTLTRSKTSKKMRVFLVTLKNGKIYLWIQGNTTNENDPWKCILQYKKGKFVKVADLSKTAYNYTKNSSAKIVKVTGNSITVQQNITSTALADVTYQVIYAYKKGSLNKTSYSYKIVDAAYQHKSKDKKGTLNNTVTLFSSPTSTKKIETVKAGTKAAATTLYMTSKSICVKIETTTGKTGWVKCTKTFDSKKLLFKECVDPEKTDPVDIPSQKITAATLLSAEEDARLKKELQKSIDDILNTKTEITHSNTSISGKTYTGTAYYISNDGDDSNDGLSPETAWKSLQRVLSCNREDVFKPGDAVLFRRGDTFRLSELGEENTVDILVNGVTYSTYGEGAKPIITASSENGTGSSKWKLVYDDDTGKKIWQFYRDMRDISRIVLNNGEAITTRVYEFYNENGYISCEGTGWWMHEPEGVTLKDRLLPLEESMTEDLSIISRPVRVNAEKKYSDDYPIGPLYLRCDAGNPGELYESIEFSEYRCQGIFYLDASNVVMDNLSFRCGGNSYMKPRTNWKEITNTLIQNCEFAYGGGCVTYYYIREDGAIVDKIQGDGIYSIVRNTTIQNNYFHDATMSDGTYEASLIDPDQTPVDGYYHYLDNVSVNTYGIRLDSSSETLQYLDSVKVCGNQVWNTGHFSQGKLNYSEGAFLAIPNHYGEFIIENNVFYGTEKGHPMNSLLNLFAYTYEYFGCTRPQFGNNIYAQYTGRNFGDFLANSDTWSIDDPELLIKAEELLCDTTSKFYIIPIK